MRTLTLLSFFVTAAALTLTAQQPIPSNAMPPISVTAAAAPVTVTGCVLGLNGGYSLHTDAHKSFVLGGADLSRFSGQKIRVLGTIAPAAKSGTNSGASPTLTVIRVDKLADTCSAH